MFLCYLIASSTADTPMRRYFTAAEMGLYTVDEDEWQLSPAILDLGPGRLGIGEELRVGSITPPEGWTHDDKEVTYSMVHIKLCNTMLVFALVGGSVVKFDDPEDNFHYILKIPPRMTCNGNVIYAPFAIAQRELMFNDSWKNGVVVHNPDKRAHVRVPSSYSYVQADTLNLGAALILFDLDQKGYFDRQLKFMVDYDAMIAAMDIYDETDLTTHTECILVGGPKYDLICIGSLRSPECRARIKLALSKHDSIIKNNRKAIHCRASSIELIIDY